MREFAGETQTEYQNELAGLFARLTGADRDTAPDSVHEAPPDPVGHRRSEQL
jgi:hypothetical protein